MTSVSESTAQMPLHDLGAGGRQRERPHLVGADAEVAGDVLQELPGARGALAGHLRAQHPARPVDAPSPGRGARRCPPPPARLGTRKVAPARVGRHAVEVPVAERRARRPRRSRRRRRARSSVGLRLLERRLVGQLRHLRRVAPVNALAVTCRAPSAPRPRRSPSPPPSPRWCRRRFRRSASSCFMPWLPALREEGRAQRARVDGVGVDVERALAVVLADQVVQLAAPPPGCSPRRR